MLTQLCSIGGLFDPSNQSAPQGDISGQTLYPNQNNSERFDFGGGLGNQALAFNHGDPSKVDMNNLMFSQGPNGASIGYRNNENGSFVPVTEQIQMGSGIKPGLYQGNFANGFYEYGNSPDDVKRRMAAIFPSINANYFKSQEDIDRVMRQVGMA